MGPVKLHIRSFFSHLRNHISSFVLCVAKINQPSDLSALSSQMVKVSITTSTILQSPTDSSISLASSLCKIHKQTKASMHPIWHLSMQLAAYAVAMPRVARGRRVSNPRKQMGYTPHKSSSGQPTLGRPEAS